MGGLTTKSTARILVLFLVLTAAGIASAEETVVFLGDSLTAGGAWAEWFPDKRAVNLGVSGDTVRQVRGRVGLVSEARPDKVFIMAGINDLAAGLAPPTAAAEYRVLVEALQDAVPRAELYIQCVLPVNRKLFNGRDLNENVRDLNRRLARLAAESGRGLYRPDAAPGRRQRKPALRPDLRWSAPASSGV